MSLRFSIIVPTRNRAALLDRCLAAMSGLDYARTNFEVLVVDDGSEPPLDDVIAQHPGLMSLQVFRAEGVGPASARNIALKAASGEYVVFTDDDCRPDPKWLLAFDEAIQRHPGSGFGGRIVDSPENAIYGRASQLLVSFLYDYSESSNGLRFFCSNNLVFPRLQLLEMGGFDESFPLAAAEDRYICARWLKQGELEFVPAAIVEHRQLLGLRSFFRQQFRYGRGACQFWRRRHMDEQAENRLEPWHFYSRMLAYPFAKVAFNRAIAMSALLALSQFAVALGYYSEKLKTAEHDCSHQETSQSDTKHKVVR
jgi:glycosyltransferase involved in cell wall biosynthesis